MRKAVARLERLESESLARLSRLEENLRLLRQDLIGDGQPGRIPRMEQDLRGLRAYFNQQRGVWAAITFVVSLGVALISRLLQR